jgi:hypothetical protein
MFVGGQCLQGNRSNIAHVDHADVS